jgi:hypothetical protein
MNTLRVVLCLGLGIFLMRETEADGRVISGRGPSQSAARSHRVYGTVVKVHHHNNARNGPASVTVRIHHRTPNQNVATTTERSFVILPGTQILKQGQASGIGHLHRGEHVVIQTVAGQPRHAAQIQIVGKRNRV